MAKKKFTPISADQDLAAVRGTIAALQAREGEIVEIIERLNREISPEQFDAAVDAVVTGADPVAAAAQLDNTRALNAARTSLRLVQAAIGRARQQEAEALQVAKGRFVAAARPVYTEISRRFASKLIELAELQAEILAFREALKEAGLGDWPAGEGPLGLGALGDVRHERSPAASWLIAQIAHGVLDAKDVPPSLAAGWPFLRDLAAYDEKAPNVAVLNRVRRLPAEVGLPTSRLGKRVAVR